MFVALIYSVVFLGENKVSFMSAVRFIKLLFQYKQPDAFTQLAGEMLQVLSVSGTQASIVISITQKRRIHSTCWVSDLRLICALFLNDLDSECLFVSLCVRARKVSHTGRQKRSLLCFTVSTVCSPLREVILETAA